MSFKKYLTELTESKKVKIPNFKSEKSVFDFISKLKPDETPDEHIVNPETGEVLMEPGQTKRKIAKKEYKTIMSNSEDNPAIWVPTYNLMRDKGNWDGEDIFKSIYNIVMKDLSKEVEDPQAMADADYDVNLDYPSIVKRKDGKPLDDFDKEAISDFYVWQEWIIQHISPGIKLYHRINGKMARGSVAFT